MAPKKKANKGAKDPEVKKKAGSADSDLANKPTEMPLGEEIREFYHVQIRDLEARLARWVGGQGGWSCWVRRPAQSCPPCRLAQVLGLCSGLSCTL